ncbi:MAG: hypothetical protein CND84_01125 [Marine Group II euryarchaeote MED-G35]|nr:MAG: hypothetical protein CND84_01125 [Marine Group II euryarchaeote MED-G35]
MILDETQIPWVSVEPGSVLVGSDDRSILFGGIGPRHEVKIDYSFRISERPLDFEEVVSIEQNSDMEIVSDSEWQLAYSRGLLSGIDGSSESLADSARDYWGKPCDGRPFVNDVNSPSLIRIWKSGRANTLTVFSKRNTGKPVADGVRMVVRGHSGWSENPLSIPNGRNSTKVIIEEILICTIIGILPSFVWAFFNASPSYIREGWLNLVLGGVFFSMFTMLFWRPRQPTWRIESDRMTPSRRNRRSDR